MQQQLSVSKLYQHRPQTVFQAWGALAKEICGAKMNAKETDQRACNINAVGCATLRKNLPHDATALPHSRPRADKVQRRGRMVDLRWQRADTWRTKSGHMADTHEADTKNPTVTAWGKKSFCSKQKSSSNSHTNIQRTACSNPRHTVSKILALQHNTCT